MVDTKDKSYSQTLTYEAPSYKWPKASPTDRIGGKRLQHTRTEHEPDIP